MWGDCLRLQNHQNETQKKENVREWGGSVVKEKMSLRMSGGHSYWGAGSWLGSERKLETPVESRTNLHPYEGVGSSGLRLPQKSQKLKHKETSYAVSNAPEEKGEGDRRWRQKKEGKK